MYVALLALLGYAYVCAVLAQLVALTIGLILVGRIVVLKLLVALIVLGLIPRHGFIERRQKNAALQAAVAKATNVPHRVMVFVFTKRFIQLLRRMEKVPGARVK